MRAVIDLLVPSLCDGCGRRAQPPWCDDCDGEARAARPTDPCPLCAGPDTAGHACWAGVPPVRGLVALTAWRDPVARAVLRAKLEGRAEVLRALGPRLATLVAAPEPAVVVPLPTVPHRARLRGADHTLVLARAVGTALRRPTVRALRTGIALPDRGSAAAGARSSLPSGAFAPTAAVGALAGRSVLLVDDLVTTGGTVAAAARCLAGAGCDEVHVAVVARAGRHVLGD